ncbi:MAG: indole-3-glycerol phosphate synthase TrpC [Alphaproteobacteria bacterium]|nr:indole-3-glycerol phosphate synthase TrpC [Alphaproteobacteria bacterium]
MIARFAATGTALDRINADKLELVARRKTERPMADLEADARRAPPPRGFAAALQGAVAAGRYGLIAEIKKASPSKGLIRPDFDPPSLAAAYAAGGATCLSVLTDTPYFQGEDAHLLAARAAAPTLPALRKDFMLDPYQIVESRALGADCVLLILACLDDARATELCALARRWGMDVLAEVHDAVELERALKLDTPLIGINNRNLRTLQVDLGTTEALARAVPRERLLVCESGLDGPADLARMARVGARCFLIGESFMRKADVAAAVRTMLADPLPVASAAD